MRVIPVLDQLRKGLLLYDLPKIMKSCPDLCLPLFVPGDDDKVDTAFILEKCHPLFSEKGSLKYMEDGTGTPALPSEKKDFDLTVKFNHDCDIHHTVCFPTVSACTRTVTFPSAHLKTPEEFKNIMQLAMHHGESFDRV
uniref:HECT domain-containing protein n=1 Tax=Astyanax mexicanus TaxID=7994 RepID=A0A3B1K8A4_ASTMX